MTIRKLRLAQIEDLEQLDQLIKLSATELCQGFYSNAELAALNKYVFGVNRFLIDDQTYYVIEDDGIIVACGGWSKRFSVLGGDQFSTGQTQCLDPKHDPAKIRAVFVHPNYGRQGLASILMIHSENEAIRHGFESLELMATLSGVDLYLQHGFNEQGVKNVNLPDGSSPIFKPMLKSLLLHRDIAKYEIDLETSLYKSSPAMLTYFLEHKNCILGASLGIGVIIFSRYLNKN